MNTITFEQFKEYLPFLIPLIMIQYGLAIYCLIKLFKQKKIRSLNKPLWAILILLIQFLGPIIYLLTEGKEHE